MNKLLLLTFILFCSLHTITAQVKIGSAGTPNANAILELDGGTNKGLLLPKLNGSQITALTTAPYGLVIFNTTDGFLYLRKSAAWQKVSDATNTGSGGLTLPYNGSTSSATSGFRVSNNGSGDGITGYSETGDGIFGFSNTGSGARFSSISGGRALVTDAGNVGIGTINPAFLLDVNGRMRIRSNGDPLKSAGIFFDKIYTPEAQSSFLGVVNDSTLGIYDITNNGWKFFFDHRNNNLGINQSDPKAPLSFSNATGNKLDIYYGSANSRYGIGLQAALMQLYSASVNDDIAFGYGSSTSFTENMRIKGNGDVGIGIAPTEKFEIRTGNAEVGWKHSWAGGSLVCVAPSLLTPAVIRGNSAAVQLTTNTNVGLYVKLDGTIGAGVINPSRQLDVSGRMRIRGTANDLNNSAGIYFDGPTATERAFIGIETNDKVGMYGAVAGWRLSLNVNSGNTNIYNSIPIGTTAAPNSKLQVVNSVSMPHTEITDNYTLTDNDFSLRYKGTGGTVKLPPASGRAGRVYIISANFPLESGVYFKQLIIADANNNNILTGSIYHDPDGLRVSVNTYELFDALLHTQFNNTDVSLAKKRKTSVTVQSDGNKWNIISNDFQY